MRQFRQCVLACVACTLYGHPIGLLHVKQPHDSFHTVLVITIVPSRGTPYIFRLQKLAPQHLIGSSRYWQGFQENLDNSGRQNLEAKDTTGLS